MDSTLNAIWSEKYRPHKVEELIATKEIKALVQGIIDKNQIQNYLFVGTSGIGKTTIARLILDVLGYEYIIINGSLNGNIDTLRNQIQTFASTISFSGGRKYVIIDEADYLNPQSTQPALRNFIETFAGNCGFIFTANYENKIIQPLRDSRLEIIRFPIPKAELPKLAMDFTKRLEYILTQEGIAYEKDVLARLVLSKMPDWRKVINNVQRYATQAGEINAGILVNQKTVSLNDLVKPLLIEKNFGEIRKWVAINADNDISQIYSTLAEGLVEHVHDKSISDLIIIIARYQYQAAFVADQQINLAACLAEIMASCLPK